MSRIFTRIINAKNLEQAVRSLSDEELRTLRGELGRGEVEAWPAELVHGVCIVESADRFMGKEAVLCDKCHGSEVPQ